MNRRHADQHPLRIVYWKHFSVRFCDVLHEGPVKFFDAPKHRHVLGQKP